jgi:hypothetical protein
MKKVVVASLLAVASSVPAALAVPALAQDASATGAGAQAAGSAQNQITIKDPAEYNAYTNAVGQGQPAAKAQAIEAFLTQYPNSVVKQEMLEQLVGAYQAANDTPHTLDAARRLLQVDPNNLRALTYIVYVEKSQANGDQTKLDDAASLAQKGLAASKPASMSDADYQKLKGVATPIFYSAIGADATAKKDYKGAIDAYTSELKSYPDPTQTQSGPGLVDTYYLGNAYVQLDNKDPQNQKMAIYYLTRAAQFAQGQYKDTIEKAAEYWYNKYHGSMDGFDAIKTQTQASVTPPDSYNPVPAPPPPSPADLAHQAVTSTPDLSKMALTDKEFVLSNGSTEDAEKVWATLKGQTFTIPGKVITVAPDGTSVQMAVSDDAKQSNTADFTINMKAPLTTPPAAGATVSYTATFSSYTQKPPMIILDNGTAPATAPRRTTTTTTHRRG